MAGNPSLTGATCGERIATLRNEVRVGRKRASQTEFAQIMNDREGRKRPVDYTKRIITSWESNEIVPDAYGLADLAMFFGVTERWLLLGTTEGATSPAEAEFIERMAGVASALTARQRRFLRDTADTMKKENETEPEITQIERLIEQARAKGPEHERVLRESIARLTQTQSEEGTGGA